MTDTDSRAAVGDEQCSPTLRAARPRWSLSQFQSSSMLLRLSCRARATRAALVGAGRPMAAHLVRTSAEGVLTVFVLRCRAAATRDFDSVRTRDKMAVRPAQPLSGLGTPQPDVRWPAQTATN